MAFDFLVCAGQYLGESLVRFALYVVSLQGLFCYAPRQKNKAYFVRTDQWLGSPLPQAGPKKPVLSWSGATCIATALLRPAISRNGLALPLRRLIEHGR